MPAKKVTISAKPQERGADDWVSGTGSRALSSEACETPQTSLESASPEGTTAPSKRLTIDIPEELHARIKSQCALRHSKMADEIRVLLETHFSA